MVGLGDFAGAYPSTLSGGMQQRVSLARTLAIGAGVWLMDEPFAALDEMTRETLADEVLDLWHRFHPTVVWVTHHLPEAVKLADRVVLLSPRPGTVTADIAVDLPRPRDETEMPFQMVVRRARAILRGEPNDEGAVLPAVGADWR
jgi:NitT/TauT family transport system ATP-binding protein